VSPSSEQRVGYRVRDEAAGTACVTNRGGAPAARRAQALYVHSTSAVCASVMPGRTAPVAPQAPSVVGHAAQPVGVHLVAQPGGFGVDRGCVAHEQQDGATRGATSVVSLPIPR
jgi:hypothetical protein